MKIFVTKIGKYPFSMRLHLMLATLIDCLFTVLSFNCIGTTFEMDAFSKLVYYQCRQQILKRKEVVNKD